MEFAPHEKSERLYILVEEVKVLGAFFGKMRKTRDFFRLMGSRRNVSINRYSIEDGAERIDD
jgi:hypothetical protein